MSIHQACAQGVRPLIHLALCLRRAGNASSGDDLKEGNFAPCVTVAGCRKIKTLNRN